jgi:ATP-binding cassette subfamily B (MDR/TAP) protein 7
LRLSADSAACRSVETWNFGWHFAAVTAGTMATYSWFTISTTAWRTKFRRDANQADNKGATRAVDALINFEAVKVRGHPVG